MEVYQKMTLKRWNHKSKCISYVYVRVSLQDSGRKNALCVYIIFKQRSVLRAGSLCKGFLGDLEIGHAPPESYFYTVSYKTKIGLPLLHIQVMDPYSPVH